MRSHAGGIWSLVGVIVVLGLWEEAPSADRGGRIVLPKSGEERAKIIGEANALVTRYMKLGKEERLPGQEIPRHLWEDELDSLEPVRVRFDRVNVFIVMKENDEGEEGFYITTPISSYLPGGSDRFALLRLLSKEGDGSFGELYHCRMRKGATDE